MRHATLSRGRSAESHTGGCSSDSGCNNKKLVNMKFPSNNVVIQSRNLKMDCLKGRPMNECGC